MCVACSQLEKLRAALLDIRQTHVITDHYSGEDNYHHHHHHHHSEQHNDISEHVSQHMRKQLKDCLRHHQNIQRYDHVWKCILYECLPSAGRYYNLVFFQVYENVGRHNESSSVWTIPDILLNDVFRSSLHYDGKCFSLIYNKFNFVYFYAFFYDMSNILPVFCRISGKSQEISVIWNRISVNRKSCGN